MIMIYEITNNNEKIRDRLNDWKSRNYAIIKDFKFKECEKIFASIYSFEHIILMIDKEIEEKENTNNIPKTLKDEKGNVYELKGESKKIEKVFMNKWQQLNDVGLSSAERKEMNLSYEDYLKLKYAKYKGFIDMVSDMIKNGNIYYSK